MNKKIQIILSTIIAIILIGIQVSYAVPANQNIKFFEVSTTEISSGETLEMTYYINKIEYDNFKILLNSNIDNGEIYTDENVTIEEEKDAIVIEIDKTKMNLSQIKLCYVVPENTEINSKIQLTTKIIVEEEIESEDDEGNTSTKKKEKIVLEETQNVIVAEKEENTEKDNTQKDDSQKDSTQKDTDSKNSEKTDSKKTNTSSTNETMTQKIVQNSTSSNENMSQKNAQNSTNTKPGNTNMSSNAAGNGNSKNSSNAASGTNSTSSKQGSVQSREKTETATYNGSNNNYLKELKVKGIDLNTNFNKENTTYFVNVTNTSSLNITSTAEDNSAKVVVTGNDNIREGTSKILIAVTAENGNVRYYRIFVNCKLS